MPVGIIRRVLTGLVIASVIFALPGCGDDAKKGGDDAKARDKAGSEVVAYRVPSEVTVEVGGKPGGKYSGPASIAVLRLSKGPTGRGHITVGIESVVESPDGLSIAEAFVKLFDYDKDGTFTIPVTPEEGGTDAFANNVYVVAFRRGPDGKPVEAGRFEVVERPCEVRITKLGDEGSVNCPMLTTQSGEGGPFRMTWKATGAREVVEGQSGPPPTTVP